MWLERIEYKAASGGANGAQPMLQAARLLHVAAGEGLAHKMYQ